MPTIPARLLELSPPDRLRLEAWLAEFEVSWNEHHLAAQVERLPPPGQPLRLPALIELVKVDLERNWQRGRRLTLGDYTARYPELGPTEDLPPDLLLADEEIRRQFGEVLATLAAAPDSAYAGPPTLTGPTTTASGAPCVRDYEVLGKLGQGGMGAVYKARQLRLSRVVALKVVGDAASARPADLVRFLQEAEMIARLAHPNIVQIYEVGEYPGGSYLALEYVDGAALDRQVNGTPQPPREAARLVEALARAVHYAHGQGIIHRDLKPANVLLTSAGAPKITDFGLARLAELDSGLTTAGAIMGTPSYMAPEQADGRLEQIGPHTDTYALGAILYECLTGRPPFQGATVMDTLVQVRQKDPVPPHRLLGSSKPSCPADLETICLKCLEKEPRRRYTSAAGLADDLGRFLAGQPIAARPVGVMGRTRRWARRHPGWAAMLATVVGLLLVIAVGSSLMSLQLNQALRASEEERWLTLVAQARASSRSRGPGQRFEGLAAIRLALNLPVPPGHSLAELRNEAIACLALPDWRALREWDLPPGTFHWDCDDEHRVYARTDRDGHISVRRVDTDEQIATLEGLRGGAWLQFSPDGRFLVCWQEHRQRVWDLAGSPPALIVEHKSTVGGPAFHPNGRHMALMQADGLILRRDLMNARQSPQVLARIKDGPLTCLAFDRDGKQLAVATANANTVHFLDAQSGKALAKPWRLKSPVSHVAWHPDSEILAAACYDLQIYVQAMKRSRPAAVLEGCRNGGIVVRFTPDGEFLVSSGWEGVLRFWDWRTAEQILSHAGADSNLRFSRAGQLIVQQVYQLSLGELNIGREYRSMVAQSIPSKDVAYWRGAIHPDGRLLAVAMSDGVRIWDLDTRRELAWIGNKDVHGVAFAPGAVVTNGPAGLTHWPIRHEPEPPAVWQVGPPRLLNAGTPASISCSKDGQLIAQAWGRDGAAVLHRDRPAQPLHLREQSDVRSVAMNPDGRFVATGSHNTEDGLKIWDTEHGRLVKELRLGTMASAAFSPDGRWLAARGTDGSRLLTAGTWDEGPQIPPFWTAAFAPDGDMLAVATAQGVIRALDPATGQDKARLADPHQDHAEWLGFTPDGTRLVVVSNHGKAIHVWDLRRIRTELVRLGLDWDAPPYPEADHAAPAPLELRVVGAASAGSNGIRRQERALRAATIDPIRR
jgi:WD40 repeat protein